MQTNIDNTLSNLKPLVEQLSVSDRWTLLKWLVELLHQEPQKPQIENTKIDFHAVHQICKEIRNLPVLDNRSPEEIIGYNKFGGLD